MLKLSDLKVGMKVKINNKCFRPIFGGKIATIKAVDINNVYPVYVDIIDANYDMKCIINTYGSGLPLKLDEIERCYQPGEQMLLFA